MFVDDEPIVLPSKVKLSTFNAMFLMKLYLVVCVCTTPVILPVKSVAFTFVAKCINRNRI